MNKRMGFLIFFVSIMLAVGMLLQGCKGKEETTQAPQAPAESISGEVVSVDTQANTVVVKDATGADHTFSIDPIATTITRDSTTLTLAELTAGTRVEVQHQPGPAGELLARTITVMP